MLAETRNEIKMYAMGKRDSVNNKVSPELSEDSIFYREGVLDAVITKCTRNGEDNHDG